MIVFFKVIRFSLFCSTMSESAGTAPGFSQFADFKQLCFLVFGNDHLAYTLAVFYCNLFVAEVDKYDTYLTAIVSIYSARCVEYC